jgi:hypothetical protein
MSVANRKVGRGSDGFASLPSYKESEAAVNFGSCTALERFIYEQEPANFDDIWRVQLLAALVEVVDESTHCK